MWFVFHWIVLIEILEHSWTQPPFSQRFCRHFLKQLDFCGLEYVSIDWLVHSANIICDHIPGTLSVYNQKDAVFIHGNYKLRMRLVVNSPSSLYSKIWKALDWFKVEGKFNSNRDFCQIKMREMILVRENVESGGGHEYILSSAFWVGIVFVMIFFM